MGNFSTYDTFCTENRTSQITQIVIKIGLEKVTLPIQQSQQRNNELTNNYCKLDISINACIKVSINLLYQIILCRYSVSSVV